MLQKTRVLYLVGVFQFALFSAVSATLILILWNPVVEVLDFVLGPRGGLSE